MPELTVINIDNYIGSNGYEEYGVITPALIREQLDKAEGDIRVDINSSGGSVFDSWNIVNYLQSYDKGKVTTRIVGAALSAASIIFLAADTRQVYEKSYFFSHFAWTIIIGNEDEIRSELRLLEQIDRVIVEDIAALTKEKLSDVRERIRGGYHLIGKSIKDVGLATDVVEGVAKEPAKLDRDLDGEEANNLHNCMKNHKIDKSIQITNLHATKKGLFGNLKEKFVNMGGTEEVTEKEANELLAKQAAENAEVIKKLEEKQDAAIKAERARITEIYELAGADVEAAKKAVNEVMSSGDFAKQQLRKSQAEKQSWKNVPDPTNDKDLVDTIPDKLEDQSIVNETHIVTNFNKSNKGGK